MMKSGRNRIGHASAFEDRFTVHGRYMASTALLPEGWRRNVAIHVSVAGDIVSVEPEARPEPGDIRLDGPAIPGLANLHSHAFQRAMAGLTESRGAGGKDDFWGWRDRMYRFLAVLDPAQMAAIAAQLYVEMLTAGYTAVAEFHYVHHRPDGIPYDEPAALSLAVIGASREAGIALTHLPVLYAAGDFGGAPAGAGQRRFLSDVDGLMEIVSASVEATRDDPDRRVGIAPHSLRAVPPEMLASAVAAIQAEDAMAPIHIHVAEQQREVEGCLAWSGARPVEWLLSHAPVDGRWCLIHATHLDERETAALAATDAVVGLCPTTEANLGDGLFPLPAYLAGGGRIGIGSDSHVSVDPWEELKLLEYGQRLVSCRRNVAAWPGGGSTGARLFGAASEGGAQALGRAMGRIEAGCRADLVVLDGDHPMLFARTGDTLLDSLIFAAGPRAVRSVMCGGRWVVREGRHRDEDRIAARFRGVMTTLLAA
jgi:formimidoylglutamate deiminase